MQVRHDQIETGAHDAQRSGALQWPPEVVSTVQKVRSGDPSGHLRGIEKETPRMRIIDPAKVVRTALANAASIAGLLLTTDAMVSTFDEEDKKKQPIEGAIA